MPVSYTHLDLHAPLFRAGVGRQRFGMALLERHADLPAGAGEFHRIGHEVHDDLLEASGVADQRDLHVRVHVYDELDAARVGVVQGHGADVVHHVVQQERGLLKLKVPGFDFRHVEQVDVYKRQTQTIASLERTVPCRLRPTARRPRYSE